MNDISKEMIRMRGIIQKPHERNSQSKERVTSFLRYENKQIGIMTPPMLLMLLVLRPIPTAPCSPYVVFILVPTPSYTQNLHALTTMLGPKGTPKIHASFDSELRFVFRGLEFLLVPSLRATILGSTGHSSRLKAL